MALTTTDFYTTFNLVPSTKLFSFKDVVDYAGQGVNPANATGVLKIVAPGGDTVYDNVDHSNPDIRPSVSLFNTTTIPLPLLGNNEVIPGEYTFTYTVRVVDNTLSSSYDVAVTKTVTYAYISPTGKINMSVNCITPLLTSNDTTNYTVNLITPTITRVHTINYPGSVAEDPIVGATKEVTTNVVYVTKGTALQYSSSCVATLSYDLTGGFYISDKVTGTGYLDVLCDSSLCDIYCALRSQYNRWFQSKGTVQTEVVERIKFDLMMNIAQLIATAITCGRDTDISGYITELKRIGNFDDCTCGDSTEPQLITGLGSNGTIVVQAGSGITVGSSTGGGVTTYTISIESSILNKINTFNNTVVAVGNGLSVSVATASDGTKTYTLTNTSLAPDSLNQIFDIRFASGSLPNISTDSTGITGTSYQAATLAADNNASAADWQANNAFFTVSAFFSGSAVAFYPEVDIIYSLKTGFSLNPYSRPYVAEIVDYDGTTFKIRITDRATGQVVTGSAVDAAYSRIKLQIKLSK